MTQAFYSDAAEKVLRGDLSASEGAAVRSVRASLEENPTPDRARGLPDADPYSQSYTIGVLPEQTGGRGITIVYRYHPDMDVAPRTTPHDHD
ncbi:hypothetical protein ABT160_44395 [Streptomyces sp. NPDC001941]|uniref:hypothetical protein n=1 Tax=Streptomyces sp. NPDC001941 TaxID=3154659 RepID=UPI00331D4B3D